MESSMHVRYIFLTLFLNWFKLKVLALRIEKRVSPICNQGQAGSFDEGPTTVPCGITYTLVPIKVAHP